MLRRVILTVGAVLLAAAGGAVAGYTQGGEPYQAAIGGLIGAAFGTVAGLLLFRWDQARSDRQAAAAKWDRRFDTLPIPPATVGADARPSEFLLADRQLTRPVWGRLHETAQLLKWIRDPELVARHDDPVTTGRQDQGDHPSHRGTGRGARSPADFESSNRPKHMREILAHTRPPPGWPNAASRLSFSIAREMFSPHSPNHDHRSTNRA